MLFSRRRGGSQMMQRGSSLINFLGGSGASLWLNYQRSALFQEATPATPSGVGDVVGYMSDALGNYNFTQTVALQKPTRQADGIKFDGSQTAVQGDHLFSDALAAAVFAGDDKPFTIAIKMRYDGTLPPPAVRMFCGWGVTGDSAPYAAWLINTSSQYQALITDGTNSNNYTQTQVTAGAFDFAILRYTGHVFKFRLNGVDSADSASKDINSIAFDRFALGMSYRNGQQAPAPITVQDMIIFPRAITDAEANSLDDFLAP